MMLPPSRWLFVTKYSGMWEQDVSEHWGLNHAAWSTEAWSISTNGVHANAASYSEGPYFW